MSDDPAASPLQRAARQRLPSASLAGLLTFAPPDEATLLGLLDDGPGILVAINAEKIANRDRDIMRVAARHLGYPDGMGATLALRRKGIRAERLPGVELWLRIVERYAGQRRFYLVGSTRPVIERVAERLRQRFPQLAFDYRDGYLSADDAERLAADLQAAGAQVVLVAMGSPRQERLMEQLYAAHPALYMGLGGSFDVLAGRVRRAPAWMRRAGLEWAYRILRQPSRLRRMPAFLRFAAQLGLGRL